MYGQGGDVQRATQTEDTMFGLQRVTHSGIDDGAPTAHEWDGAVDLLETITCKSDVAHPTGL